MLEAEPQPWEMEQTELRGRDLGSCPRSALVLGLRLCCALPLATAPHPTLGQTPHLERQTGPSLAVLHGGWREGPEIELG